MSVGLSLHKHILGTTCPIFVKLSAHVVRLSCSGSIVITLCTSGFVDDVVFSCNSPTEATAAALLHCRVLYALTPLLRGSGCILFWVMAGARTR